MPTSQRILVAVDELEASRRAVRYVADMLGGKPGFHVGLVHLELPPRMLEWGGSEDPDREAAISSERAEAYERLEKEAIEGGQGLLQMLQAIRPEACRFWDKAGRIGTIVANEHSSGPFL
jgi:hypothetical protein